MIDPKLWPYFKTPRWKQITRLVKARDNWRCRACGRRGQYPKKWQIWRRYIPLVAHHLTLENWRKKPGNEPLSDLLTLCLPCSQEAHARLDSGKCRTLRIATEEVLERHSKRRTP